MNRRLLRLTVLLGAGLACSDIATPARDEPYEWRLVVDLEVGLDTLSFHWPREMLPVRVWVEDSLTCRRTWSTASNWRDAFVPRVRRRPRGRTRRRGRTEARADPAAQGRGDGRPRPRVVPGARARPIDTTTTRFELQLPVRMYIDPKFDPGSVDLSECFDITATHEIGHSLGIFRHTGDPADMMYSDPEASGLSERYRQTAEVLSHYPANMIPVR
jgi:hypothetical protein